MNARLISRITTLIDAVETALLTPGEYAYHIRFQAGETGEPVEEEDAFILVESADRQGR